MKTVVLAHGCFDLLHLGHIRHLQEAKKLGDELVVSVTSDKYVNKGDGRPRFNAVERVEALAALSCVDRVILNDAPDAVDLIRYLKPDIYVKGSDYCGVEDEALKREMCAVVQYGNGNTVFTGTRKWSSTELLKDFRDRRSMLQHYADAIENYEQSVSTDYVMQMFRHVKDNFNRIFFIGNGGSAAIASHMAADFQKAAKIPSVCFNDAASVTALANDLSYRSIFVEPLKMHAHEDDMLVAISSSGRSNSIVDAADWAVENGIQLITMSGFHPDNPLRHIGQADYYVPSDRYGVVECTHQIILHSLLDAVVGTL